jgi:cell division protein FtsL
MGALSRQENKRKEVLEPILSRDLPLSKMLLPSLFVLVLVVASALSVIYSSYKSRQSFSGLQLEIRQAMQLEEEWGRLLLEQSTWASHTRIERMAKEKLNMIVPDSTVLIVVSP